MSIEDTLSELLTLEKRGATALTSGGAIDFYARVLSEDALLVVPGMVIDKPTFLTAMGTEPAWTTFRIDKPRVVELTSDCAVLQYEATGTRDGQADFVACMSSTYVKRDGSWRLAFHQQTPNPGT